MSLGLLFNDDDRIFICNVDDFGTKEEFVGNVFNVVEELQRKPRQFFAVNPIRGQRRAKTELARYTNFLFESDSNPIEQQYSLLPKLADLGIIRTATFSGSKSIHFIVSCADDLNIGEPGSETAEQAYKAIWLGLATIFNDCGLSVDESNKNPAVLSRIPGAFRDDNEQRLLYTGNLVTAEFLKSLALPVKNIKKPQTTTAIAASYAELEQRLNENSRLNMYIKYPGWITEGAGNYPMIFKLTLWAIDEVGATPETFYPYLEKHLVPHLQSKHYFKDWTVAVDHAFKAKGML